MIALVQRVSSASVDVRSQRIATIKRGILAFIAVQRDDTLGRAQRLLERMLNYRIFSDSEGKMNLCVREIRGELLLVPQFTLTADTHKGNRPGFSDSPDPAFSEPLFEQLLEYARQEYSSVQSGLFGANMQVTLVNDGPATFWLET